MTSATPDAARRRTLDPLRQPGFGRLAAASLVNELGNWLGEIALAVIVFDVTGSPVATAGLFVAMQFIPALATAPLIARLDALHTRRALALIYATEAATFCALAAFATSATFILVAIFALAALDGTLATAARARTRAASAAILEPVGLLREGNGILNIGFTVGAAAGPAMAGVLVAAAGAQVALLADAASFLFVAVLLATCGALPAAHEDPVKSWVARLRAGLTYVRERSALQRLLAAEGVAFIFFALVLPIEVAFAKDTLDAGDVGYGLLLAAWGVGMVLGSVLFSALRTTPLTTLLVAGTLAIGVSYTVTAAAPTLAVACAAAAIGGLGNGVQWVAVITAIQGLTEPGFQARVIALLESLASGLSGIGFLLGGVIAAIVSPRASFAVAGVGVLVVLALAVAVLRSARWERISQAGAGSGEPEPLTAPAR